MSEYYFAVLGQYASLEGGKRAARRRDKIAKKIDKRAGYTYYYDSARQQWCGWGYAPNRGAPFDASLAAEITAAWSAAGV